MSTLDSAVRCFAEYLNASWPHVSAAFREVVNVSKSELTADWLQSGWELLVETRFRDLSTEEHYLEAYSDGAESYGSNSRVWRPSATATHRIVCRAAQGKGIFDLLSDTLVQAPETFIFERFVSRTEDGWYQDAPRFDCVLALRGANEFLFRIGDVEFASDQLSK